MYNYQVSTTEVLLSQGLCKLHQTIQKYFIRLIKQKIHFCEIILN